MRKILWGVLIFGLSASPALAQSINIDLGASGALTGRVFQLIALIAVLSLAPSILIVVTSFTRIVIVLSLIRNALGAQTTPPNAVLISLALFLTAFIMEPTFTKSYNDGIRPLIEERITETDAFSRSVAPLHEFMRKHVRENDLRLFLDIGKISDPPAAADIPLRALIPAFLISELKRAFEIGFLVYIPFIVIDMVIASLLMSMGMMMLPPVVLSLPFKLIFFVLVDGWNLLSGALVKSFE